MTTRQLLNDLNRGFLASVWGTGIMSLPKFGWNKSKQPKTLYVRFDIINQWGLKENSETGEKNEC